MTALALKCKEYPDGRIDWYDGDIVHYWRRPGNGSYGDWVINYRCYEFDEWLDLVMLPDEEKLMLKLQFG